MWETEDEAVLPDPELSYGITRHGFYGVTTTAAGAAVSLGTAEPAAMPEPAGDAAAESAEDATDEQLQILTLEM